MSAPALQAYVQGQGTVNADNFNTFEQTCDTLAQLRGFVGLPGIQVYLRGFTAPEDGGQGEFYWDSDASGDNGTSIIVPTAAASGAWVRLSQTFYATTIPSSGSWVAGNFAQNTAPAVLGTSGSQYVIIGWMRLTTGSGNVLNTDWVQCRCLTGT